MAGVLVLHPGEMGASIGAALRANEQPVSWVAGGRSAVTRARAGEAGLTERPSLAEALGGSEIVISICPPDAAIDVAEAVAEHAHRGIYVDANAVAPATAQQVATVIAAGGGRYVDGGIIGPPARHAGITRLYLSGPDAPQVAACFAGSVIETRLVGPATVAASAVKMAFAAWTKGTSALLLAVRALAAGYEVDDALVSEWETSMPELITRSALTAAGTAPKAWRFVGEMDEIATAFDDAGLPSGFHEAAAEVYRRLAGFKDTEPPPDLATAVEALQPDHG